MNKLILATNVDITYAREKSDDWIKSTLKNKSYQMESVVFFVKKDHNDTFDFGPQIKSVQINVSDLHHSIQKYAVGKRNNFLCLETGEFLNYCNFNDDDILVLCDYDVTMQREFSLKEIEILNSLDKFQFACNRDSYKSGDNLLFFYENFSKIGKLAFGKDVADSWLQYNTGIQAGRISAWKNLFETWQQVSDTFMKNVPHHFSFQMYFSSFLNRHNLCVEMPETFHNAHWFSSTRAIYKNNFLFVGDEKVLFYHHKFSKKPSF